jgi:hypothetical protein
VTETVTEAQLEKLAALRATEPQRAAAKSEATGRPFSPSARVSLLKTKFVMALTSKITPA